MLFAVGRQKYDLIALAIGAAINLVLNIYFTLSWGYIGTAYATTISAGVLFLMHCFFFYKFMYNRKMLLDWFNSLLAGAIFFLSSIFLAKINLYLGFILSLVIYFLILAILKVIRKNELIYFVKAVFNRG
jgi:O-antigen/teichoic acid export membrane protein